MAAHGQTSEHRKTESELDNLSTLKNHSDNIGSINNMEERPISIGTKRGCGGCCGFRKSYDNGYRELGDSKGSEWIFSPRTFCKWCCGCSTICFLLIIIIVFAGILPSVAQSSMDNASLITVHLAMINPTKDSITLNSTLQVVNAGSFDATMETTTATLLCNGSEVGKFVMPELSIIGGTGATFSLLSQVNVTSTKGLSLFRNMSKLILNGTDVTVTFKAKPKLKPKIMGISMPKVSVNLNKDLVIPGSRMQDPHIFNFTANSIEPPAGLATIIFSIPSILHIRGENVTMSIFDTYNNELGYAIIPTMDIVPGYNKIGNAYTEFVYCSSCSNTSSWNNDTINSIAMSWLGGNNTIVNLRGPTNDLVISHSINQDVKLYGCSNGVSPGTNVNVCQTY